MIKKFISMTSHALDPPVTNCHTFSDPLPLERDVLYGRPLTDIQPSELQLLARSNDYNFASSFSTEMYAIILYWVSLEDTRVKLTSASPCFNAGLHYYSLYMA